MSVIEIVALTMYKQDAKHASVCITWGGEQKS